MYVGGQFNAIDGVSALNIAYREGAQWYPLGGGVNGTVQALVVNGDSLFVGGDFETVIQPNNTTLTVNHIARWDGSQWHALGAGTNDPYIDVGLNDTVWALAPDSGNGVSCTGGADWGLSGGVRT